MLGDSYCGFCVMFALRMEEPWTCPKCGRSFPQRRILRRWTTAQDGSAMKVSERGHLLKTESITDAKRPHEHSGTVVNRNTGSVEQFYVGKHADPGGKGKRRT